MNNLLNNPHLYKLDLLYSLSRRSFFKNLVTIDYTSLKMGASSKCDVHDSFVSGIIFDVLDSIVSFSIGFHSDRCDLRDLAYYYDSKSFKSDGINDLVITLTDNLGGHIIMNNICIFNSSSSVNNNYHSLNVGIKLSDIDFKNFIYDNLKFCNLSTVVSDKNVSNSNSIIDSLEI